MTKDEINKYWGHIHTQIANAIHVPIHSVQYVRSDHLGYNEPREAIFLHFQKISKNPDSTPERVKIARGVMTICSDRRMWDAVVIAVPGPTEHLRDTTKLSDKNMDPGN